MPSLFPAFVRGQSDLATLSAEEQDAQRRRLLEQLCGPSDHRYKPNGFGPSDPCKALQLEPWRAELLDLSQEDVGASKAHLFRSRPAELPRILFVMTTCKRLDLFLRTMHAFARHCLDCWQITEWVVLDDGSSKEDVESMRAAFPFLQVLEKRTLGLPRGHASSLNELWWHRGVEGKFDFIFQMEDDWQLFRSDHYIGRCLHAINSSSGGARDQVLVNRAYAETVFCLACVGGHWNPRAGCWDHDHQHPEPRATRLLRADTCHEYGSHAYWPGFSLRPGLIRCNSIRGLRPFRTDGRHFEMEFAQRWPGRTSYLPEISAWHIGRLTSERHADTHTLNAYELNGVDQFGKPEVGSSKVAASTSSTGSSDMTPSQVVVPTTSTSTSTSTGPPNVTSSNVTPSQPTTRTTTRTGPADVAPPQIVQASAIPAPANTIAGSITHRAMHELFYKMGADRISLSQYRPRGLPPVPPFPASFESWVVNLDRRPDRLKQFCDRNGPALKGVTVARLSATDGQQIRPSHHWDRLAAYGDFHHHRAMMACAVSHLRLWQHLATQDRVEWMLVMEDDVVLAPDFRARLQSQVATSLAEHHALDWHIVWLGFHASPHSPLWGVDFGVPGQASTLSGEVASCVDVVPAQRVVVQRWDLRTICRQSQGGTHAYMLHKRGAVWLLEHLRRHGMVNGIDWVMWHCPGSLACLPPIAHAASPAAQSVDTDIQIVSMNLSVSVFGERLEARPCDRELHHLYELLAMSLNLPLPTVVHVPVSMWLAQHPSLLFGWAAGESWFWGEFDVVWLRLEGLVGQVEHHPQREQPLLLAVADAVLAVFGAEVDWLCLSNSSVVVILSPELFDGGRVNEYFCLGRKSLDVDWVAGMSV